MKIEDNNYVGKEKSISEIKDLIPLANKSIKTLCEENENILVFPTSIMDSNDRIGDSSIFDLYLKDSEYVNIKTNNVLGFIGRKAQQLHIYSRFDHNDRDYFLHYMLQRVFSFNMFNLDYSTSDESIFDFLIYIFSSFLKNALKQGVYKEYQRFEHNDSNIRGTVDVNRHIKCNIPFRGNVAYTTREHTTDNNITQLIRHTIEYIKTLPSGKAILDSDLTSKENVRTILDCTSSYQQNQRQRIIQKNLRSVNHPFYTEYAPLQRLCLQILRQEEIKYGEESDSVHGILFDGAWLWEEYLNTILEELEFKHPENKLGTGAIYLFEHGGQRFPDFWRNDCVLDAKYKSYGTNDSFDVGREDVHQVITYMYRLKAKTCGVICPSKTRIKPICNNLHMDSYGGTFVIYNLHIPQDAADYDSFVTKIQESESELTKSILEQLLS